jgi:hypothetical protein
MKGKLRGYSMNIELTNLKKLYRQLLEVDTREYKDEICPFFMQFGETYFRSERRCLFIGKSVNGWITNNRSVDDLFDLKNPNRIVNRDDQMAWVAKLEGPNDEYNTRKSSFWRLIKGISLEYIGQSDWHNHIAWSNLYKLSPYIGNPNSNLQKLQRMTCIAILNEEINILRPTNVIFFTSGWEHFYLQSIGIIASNANCIEWGNSYSLRYSIFKDISYIQTQHPQGKPEKQHIQAILSAMQYEE